MPYFARPHGSASHRSRPHSLSENGGLAITQSKVSEAAGARVREGGVAERVLAGDLKVLDAVQHQVHARDRRGGQVLLLAVDLAEEGARVAALARDVLDRAEQHAARAAGRIVDRLAFLRVEHLDHHPHDAARGVELAGLVASGDVGELADQVLVGVAEHVGADRRVAERDGREALDQILQQLVGELLACCPSRPCRRRGRACRGWRARSPAWREASAAPTFAGVSRTSLQ